MPVANVKQRTAAIRASSQAGLRQLTLSMGVPVAS